jgi:flavodoxin
MKKAVIFYQSKTGTTKKYAKQIGNYLQGRQIEATCLPVNEFQGAIPENIDYIFMGCWTKGLMVLLQHPDEIWKKFAAKITIPSQSKLVLFATYKISTGSMFRKMKNQLRQKDRFIPNLKSRNGQLSEKDKAVLKELIAV